jgi:hypothetical protein
MMLDLYRNYADPLTDETMFEWHKMLLAGDKGTGVIGDYRRQADAMQVVSGRFTSARSISPSPRAPTHGHPAAISEVLDFVI